MGYAVTWFAIPDPHFQSFLDRLGLVPTGETEEWPESLICSGRMDTGWTVLWYNKPVCPFLTEPMVREYSQFHDLLVCEVEEHVMCCSATLWRGGKPLWHLSHDGSGGAVGLEAEGDLPDFVTSIREEMEARQAQAEGLREDVDFLFEIPMEAAQKVTGFKHDEDPEHLVGGQFSVLRQVTLTPTRPEAQSPSPGFWKRIFSRPG